MSDILDYPIKNEAKYVLYTSSLLADEDGKVVAHFDITITGDDIDYLEAYWKSLPNWDTTMMHVIYDNKTKQMIKILSSCCGGV